MKKHVHVHLRKQDFSFYISGVFDCDITCKDILLHVGKSRKVAALSSLQQHRHFIHL